ncbi:TspO/MBR family protein [Sphingomonas sp. 1P08PE]|uniref:TspO/MBR family protein n=1 Tax=Sphingomonas sp. 1P08PE TaxID=554122 RepID=UPI0039A02BA6
MSFLRWAVVTVPLILLLGFASGRAVVAGQENGWYAALAKPAQTPPDWLFPVAWTTLYVLLGLAVAIVINARGARTRWPAIAAFVVAFGLSLAWTPLFFGAHRIQAALWLIVAMLAAGIVTTFLFGRVRSIAAWLMVPYLVWISFAGVLTWRIGQLNPDGQGVAPPPHTSQML